MYIDDEVAIQMMIQIMRIDDEPDMIQELRKHVEEHGAEKLFVDLFKLYSVLLSSR